MSRAVSSGCSNCGTWPQSSITTERAEGSAAETNRAKPGRHEHVAVAPQEQRGRLQPGQPVPEAVAAERLVQIDVAQRGEGGQPVRPRPQYPAELVDGRLVPRRGQPARVGEQRAQPAQRHGTRQPDGQRGHPVRHQAHQRHELAQLAERDGRAEQYQPPDRVGPVQRGLQCRPAAEAVADEDGGPVAGLAQERCQPGTEVGGPVRGGARLGSAVAGQVRGEHAVGAAQLGQQRQHRGVGRRQAVHQHHRGGVRGAGLEVEGLQAVRAHRAGVGAGVVTRVAGEQPVQLQRQGEVAADRQVTGEEGRHPAAPPGDDVVEHGQRGAHRGRRSGRGAAARRGPAPVDLDRPGGQAAGGEQDGGDGVGQQRRVEPEQPPPQQRQQVVVRRARARRGGLHRPIVPPSLPRRVPAPVASLPRSRPVSAPQRSSRRRVATQRGQHVGGPGRARGGHVGGPGRARGGHVGGPGRAGPNPCVWAALPRGGAAPPGKRGISQRVPLRTSACRDHSETESAAGRQETSAVQCSFTG